MKTRARDRYLNPDKAKKRLVFWLLIFFIGISLPVYFLLHKVYSQLENEIWYNQRGQAEVLVERIERQLLGSLQVEQERPIAEYSFFNVLENPLLQSTTVNVSPLSEIPPKTTVPGLIGYFQINPDGSFHSPALPELNQNSQTGLSADELASRIALKNKLQQLLALGVSAQVADKKSDANKDTLKKVQAPQSSLQMSKRFEEYFQAEQDSAVSESELAASPAEKTLNSIAPRPASPALSEEKLQQLNIETKLWQKKSKANETLKAKKLAKDEYRQQARKETVKIPDQSLASRLFSRNRATSDDNPAKSITKQEQMPAVADAVVGLQKNQPVTINKQTAINILSFESEVSPLQRLTLEGRYLCFYRNAWHGKARYIQGFIVDGDFLQKSIQPILDTTNGLSLSSVLLVDKGNVLQQFKITTASSELLLFRRTLSSPFQHMEILVNAARLPYGSGKKVLDLISASLALVIPIGFILFYRLGTGQIELARQQSNFISSVSHELKTPLTSIRMYAEMLRANWVSDDSRKQGYYDYIYFESERLSRLIANVLQLARLDNHQGKIQLVTISARVLLQLVQARVAVQVEAANYQLNLLLPDDETDVDVQVDEDAFFQIMINLVDNAIKFSKSSGQNVIDMGYKLSDKNKVLVFFVRDYGPGVEKEQMKKIFRLFYRAGDEMTRTQPGTGIGLALVAQLAEAMQATVDLVNRVPGAEFQVRLNLNSKAK